MLYGLSCSEPSKGREEETADAYDDEEDGGGGGWSYWTAQNFPKGREEGYTDAMVKRRRGGGGEGGGHWLSSSELTRRT